MIPDGIYKIQNGAVILSVHNYGNQPLQKQEKINHDLVLSTTLRNSQNIESTLEIPSRIQKLQQSTRLQHIEEKLAKPIWKIIVKYNDIHSLEGDPVPCTTVTEHEIVRKSGKVINIKSYRPLECHKEEVTRQISELHKKRGIRDSSSTFNSPTWVVPKKADASEKEKWRIVIDFRKINDTDQEAYPLPVINDNLDQLGQEKFFSTFDLNSGFHQIPMSEGSNKYTAFSTLEGHFEFNRMAFDVKNAPPAFQRMMDNALRGLVGKKCFVYLDDIIVFGSTIEEHNQYLVKLLGRLRQVGS